MSSSATEVGKKLNTLRMLLPALLIIGLAAAMWLGEQPLRRAVPLLIAELLVLAALAYYVGVVPL